MTVADSHCEGALCFYGLESLRNVTRIDEERVFNGG
jgi:hypothetical protein